MGSDTRCCALQCLYDKLRIRWRPVRRGRYGVNQRAVNSSRPNFGSRPRQSLSSPDMDLTSTVASLSRQEWLS